MSLSRNFEVADGMSKAPRPAPKMEQTPYVFVVGCPRSGTTLLQRMLDHHPQLAVANDTHFIPRVLEKLAPEAIAIGTNGRDIPLTANLIKGVRTYHRFSRLGLSDEDVDAAAAESKSYQEFVRALYCAFAKHRECPLAGEKTPDYVRHFKLLHGMFPMARMVHLVRDGRDVALSLREWANEHKGPGRVELWKSEPMAVCALWWRWLVGYGRQSGVELGSTHYCEVRYESLIGNVTNSLQEISRFLELPFAAQMAKYHERRTRPDPRLSAKSGWLPPTPGLRDWRQQMSTCDVELFEALAGDLLSEFGYERAFDRISPSINKRARLCIDWWELYRKRREERFLRRVESR